MSQRWVRAGGEQYQQQAPRQNHAHQATRDRAAYLAQARQRSKQQRDYFDDDDEDDEDEDDEDEDDEDEGEAWMVETGRADDGGVARGRDEARGERRRIRARGERRMRARGVRIGDGDDRDRGRVRGAIGATEIGG